MDTSKSALSWIIVCAVLGAALAGCVETRTPRVSATAVDDHRRVDNNLLVRGTETGVGETIADSAFTAKVKAALVGDPVTKARQISVETQHGVVRLLGFVDSEAESAQATVVAMGVAGVHEVRNDLAVKQSL